MALLFSFTLLNIIKMTYTKFELTSKSINLEKGAIFFRHYNFLKDVICEEYK